MGTVEELIDLAIRKRALRLRDGDREVELHPSAFGGAETAPAAGQDKDRCNCSHSLTIEHNEMGCLLGCANALCAPEGARA